MICQIVWPVITSTGVLIGAYRGYIRENIYQTEKLVRVQKEITEISLEVKNLISKNLDFRIELKGIIDKIQNNTNTLSITDSYQQTLRKEVKDLAEGKLNISEFWNYVNLFHSVKRGGNND